MIANTTVEYRFLSPIFWRLPIDQSDVMARPDNSLDSSGRRNTVVSEQL